MLEHRELWLESWSTLSERRFREVREPDNLNTLGQARLRPQPDSWWRRWLSRPTLEVVETEDESLIFTIHQLWGWGAAWWEVRDAEGRCVGIVSRGEVRDSLGRLVGRVEPPALAGGGRILSPEGPELASVAAASAGSRLTFGAVVEEDPFAKMLLFSVLLLELPPRDDSRRETR